MVETNEYLTVAKMEEIIREVISRFLIPKFLELDLNASGEWIQSLEARGNSIFGRDYTEYLVRGRGPNRNQDPEAIRAWVGYYGSTVLAEWVKNKGLDINPFAVAYKIAREGTTIKERGGTDLLEVLQSEPVIEYIREEVADFAKIQVEIQIKRDLKKAFK